MIGPQLPPRLKRKRDTAETENSPQPALKRVRFACTEKEEDDECKDSRQEMHPRNIYRYHKPNFHQLSQQYDFFREVVKRNENTGDYYIDYNDAKSNVMLTKVLLKHDFGLEFEHPINHLCPPITQRLNYLLWLQDLLQCINTKSDSNQFHGLDIGVGASCIFPLLGIKIGETQHEQWTFTASDIDAQSVEFANKNAELNGLTERIKIVHQTNAKQIFKGVVDEKQAQHKPIDFTVCNPPFFEHLQETGLNKARTNNATQSELVYEDGGEVGFVKLMIEEIKELALYSKISWFTTMLGKKSSLKGIEAVLRNQEMSGKTFIVSTAFYQGKQVRWGLAWTYDQEIKHKYDLMYGQKQEKQEKQEILQRRECLFDWTVAAHIMDYDEYVMNKLQQLFKKYGIKMKQSLQSLRAKSKHEWIEIDNVKDNAFSFSMKWIIQATQSQNKRSLSIILTFRFHQGDLMLFQGFVDWFDRSVST